MKSRETKEKAIRMFQLGMSYKEISEELLISKQAVGHHCREISRHGAKVTEDILAQMKVHRSNGLSYRSIADILNISSNTVMVYLKGKPVVSNHRIDYYTRINEANKKLKQKCVDYKGGKCSMCGYSKYLGALEFHHLDPLEKDFSIASKKNFDKLKSELDKCILLCSNCHKETHGKLGGTSYHKK